jgi:hypothetical protein
MSVYVGIDVHRKRSQVAVVTESGQVRLNKNVVNGSEPMLRLIGDLPPGTPVAFEAAFGWGWLVQLLEDYGFDPHLPLTRITDHRAGPATEVSLAAQRSAVYADGPRCTWMYETRNETARSVWFAGHDPVPGAGSGSLIGTGSW